MSRFTAKNESICNYCEYERNNGCIKTDPAKCVFNTTWNKLKHYEDLEEQGRLIELDLNELKRDELDRCTHRHCNNCDKYRLELQLYKDNDKRIKQMIGVDMAEASARFASYMKMKDEGRLIELPCLPNETVWVGHKKYSFGELFTELQYTSIQAIIKAMENGFVIGRTKEEAQRKLAELKGEQDVDV